MITPIGNFLASLVIVHTFVFPLKSRETIYGLNNGKYIEVSGINIYYEEYGEGEPILMLHGGPGSIANFSKIIPDPKTIG
jgi:hypothetical protein